MSITLPGELVEVMEILGFNWPHADEDKIFECGHAWKDYAGEVERVIADADRACREAVERNRGEAITAFEGHWRELGSQGDLRRAADAAVIVSDALELFGHAVIAMKLAIIAQLTATAAAVIASVASAIFTAGLSTLAGAGAVQAARIAVREIIEELIEKLVKTIIPKLKHEALEIFEKMIKRLRRYLDEVAIKLRQMQRRGSTPDVPRSGLPGGGRGGGIPNIGGRRPRNSKWAGKIYDGKTWTEDVAAKYPKGVRFTEQGFPDFSPYAKARVQVDDLTNKYGPDAAAANRAVGLPSTPKGYTWHHVEDGRTMMLIPKDLHNAVPHTGGAAVIRNGGFDPN